MSTQFLPGLLCNTGDMYSSTCLKKNLNSETHLALRFSDNKGTQTLITIISLKKRQTDILTTQKKKDNLRIKDGSLQTINSAFCFRY